MWQQRCKSQGASICSEYLSKAIISGTAGSNIHQLLPVINPFFLTSIFFIFPHDFICKTSLEMCTDILTENRYHWICQSDWWTFPKRFANAYLSLACEWFIPICWEMTSRVFHGSEICPRMLISVSAANWHAWGISLTPKSSIDPAAG